jgi:hypothetical protein
MLKNVVFPAPFGPIMETIARSGMSKVTRSTARRPPKALVTSIAFSSVPSAAAADSGSSGRTEGEAST